MTYADKFVVEVKQGGKILRVKDGAVYLPFGSEYSIYLKNLNSKRANVNISIDGEDVLDNHSLILDANSSTELQGFLRGNVAKNRFRFIQKTKQISEHRGDRADDGLVRVEFAFEKPKSEPWIAKTIKEVHHHHHHDTPIRIYGTNADWRYTYNDTSGRSIEPQSIYSSSMGDSSKGEVVSDSLDSWVSESLGVQNVSEIPNTDEGITVKGSEVNQHFNYASIGDLEESTVIVIALRGLGQSGQKVQETVTVQDKLQCSSCGTKSKSSFKFCPSCGTYLE